jgi:hypothetical protein
MHVPNYMSVDFNGKSIVARSLKGDWSFSMELTQRGASDQLKPVNKPSVHATGARFTYDRGNIKEWYINDPKGL